MNTTPLWQKLLQWLPYIAIPVALALGAHVWTQWRTINRLEKRIETLYDQRQVDHEAYMQKIEEQKAKIEGRVAEGKEESRVVKVDIGKTIKEFNRDIKATKKIGTATDSAAALHDVWSK